MPEANELDRAAKLGAFGAAGGVALLLFASGIPRVKRDILQVSKGAFVCWRSQLVHVTNVV